MKRYKWLIPALLALALAGCARQDDGPTLAEDGMAAIESENYEGAIKSFSASIEAGEDELVSYRGMGMAYLGQGNYEEAVKSLDQALGMTDENMQETKKDLLYYKAAALYRQEDFSGAVSACDEILQIAGEADAYYLRGACYLELDEGDKAKVNFDAAVGKTPQDFDLYLNIYECYKEKKLSAEGDAYLQQAMAIETDTQEAAYQRARIYFAMESYEEAKKELDELVEAQNGDAMLLMGQVYLAMEDYAHSRSMYQQYMEKEGESARAYNGVVLADLAEGDSQGALEHISAGLKLEDEDGRQELLFNEIVAYEYERDFQTAKEKAEAYVQQYPQDEAGQKEYEFLKSR